MFAADLVRCSPRVKKPRLKNYNKTPSSSPAIKKKTVSVDNWHSNVPDKIYIRERTIYIYIYTPHDGGLNVNYTRVPAGRKRDNEIMIMSDARAYCKLYTTYIIRDQVASVKKLFTP